MSNFQSQPVQESNTVLKSGIKIQCFRRDPSKFFAEISKWAEFLNIGRIENWTVAADPSGHITLIVAYREHSPDDPQTVLLRDTVELVNELSTHVKELAHAVSALRPPVSSSEFAGAGGVAK